MRRCTVPVLGVIVKIATHPGTPSFCSRFFSILGLLVHTLRVPNQGIATRARHILYINRQLILRFIPTGGRDSYSVQLQER
jgi:hypothetical protein